MTRVLLYLIKLVQVLMLLAALAAFGYGVWHLGDALWLRVAGKVVEGRVVRMGASTESRPVVQYSWPLELGELRLVTSPLALKGRAIERFRRGSHVQVRVLPSNPDHARPILPLAAYFWPSVAFASGLLGLMLVGGLFFMHEEAFGRDVSAGLSLWRGVRLRHLLVVAAFVAALVWAVRAHAPWLGIKELTALVTGEIRYLYPLLKARGEPPPGRPLNDAEAALARVPWLGMAYASTALEEAIFHREKADVRRFLDAYADPAVTFPVRSRRALSEAIRRRDLDTVTRLLVLGFEAEDAQFEPLAAAIKANRPDLAQTLVDAGMRLEARAAPNEYARLALARRAEASFLWLLDQGAVDATAIDPKTGDSLLDLALKLGMPRAAHVLWVRGAPTRLPAYARAVVDGDVEALRTALPESKWTSWRIGSIPLLHLAAQFGHRALAKALLAAGAKPNAKANTPDHPGVTALHLAAEAGNAEVLEILLAHPRLEVDRRDGRAMSALGYALIQNHWPIVRALIEAGANPSQKVRASDGDTALHFAARKGDADAIRFLLGKGADPAAGSFSGMLPIDVAREEVRGLLVTPQLRRLQDDIRRASG